jgi:type IV pilus assembly protein PilE
MTPTRPLCGNRQNGFTLIEAMIVVAIVAILAAVAYPTYNSQVRKSRRSDATASFITIQQAQERFRANNIAYTEDLTALTVSATSPEGYYTMSITAGTATGTGYEVVATAVAGKSQVNDTGCSTLTVVVSNGAATYNEPNCWSK